MMMRTINARQPALTWQEAALLTALPLQTNRTTNLWMPAQTEHFMAVDTMLPTADTNTTVRRGSIAGRAVLHTAGISMPGVTGMRRGCCRAQDRQVMCGCANVVYELL